MVKTGNGGSMIEIHFSASVQFYELRKHNLKSLPIITSYVYSIIINAWMEALKLNLNEKLDTVKTKYSKRKLMILRCKLLIS